MFNYSNIFDSGMNYSSYRELVHSLLLAGKTTGEDSSEAMLHYTKMNEQRMSRVEKTTVLTADVLSAIANIKKSFKFLVITEGWCGDAAQIVPVINQIVSAAPEKFSLKLVLRDQNLPLIDTHLTNGGRAIPVLLILDDNNELVLPKWGPRPAVLQTLLADWKQETSDMMVLAERLHGWYAKDKKLATQGELLEVLRKLE
ncbi:MAG: thioredoxin family protein [Flavobacterium sp.]|nr:MAG: thioredoxin family protein [Flavobacterium sp.]